MSDVNNMANWPTTVEAPPMAEVAAPPMADPSAMAGNVIVAEEAKKSHNLRTALLGGALVVTSLVGPRVVDYLAERPSEQPKTAAIANKEYKDASGVDVCPKGMFPDGPYEATQKAFGNNELFQRPDAPLTDAKSLSEYAFGDKPGVACRSVEALAGFSGLYTDLLGGGNLASGFGGTDLNDLANTYKNDKDKAQRDVKVVDNGYSRPAENDENITKPMFQLIKFNTGNPDQPYKMAYLPVNVDFKKGTAFVYSWQNALNDGDQKLVDKDQTIVLSKETGQIFVTKAIGAEIAKPQDLEQKDQPGEGGTQGGNTNGGGGNGSGEKGITEGPNGESLPGPIKEATPGNDRTPGPGNNLPTPGPGNSLPTPGPTPPTGPRPTTPNTVPPTAPPTTPRPTTPPTVPPTSPPTTHPKGSEPAPNPSIPN